MSEFSTQALLSGFSLWHVGEFKNNVGFRVGSGSSLLTCMSLTHAFNSNMRAYWQATV